MENDQPQPQQEPHQEPQTPQSQQPQQSQSAHQTPSQHAQLNPQPQRPTHSRFPPPSHAPPSGTFLDLSFAPVPTLADLQALIQPAILDLDLTGNKLHELPELTQLVNLERFCIRQNYVTTLAGKFPEQCNKLDTVDLYDNRIESTEALKHFTSITYLDASFNELRVIEPHLASLTNLKELYLINNKITDIDAKGLVPLSALTLLELGSNRIRDIQNLDSLTNLRKLFLGRNKLTEIKGLSALHSLTCLSLQHNRITVIEGLDGLGQLQELYLSNNGITSIQGLSALVTPRWHRTYAQCCVLFTCVYTHILCLCTRT
eukprot:c8036_g1_i1.p1 GENE.c8036_g1_i1~~c8036_g1_i1.p1  ORF type:complete len:334 (-),score=80.35 c8036_g1_i1:206-1156(-)